MQIMETCPPDKSQPDLITHVQVEPADKSDTQELLLPSKKARSGTWHPPSEVLADSLYGGDENVEQAKEQGVEVIAPAMGISSDPISLAEFSFSPTDEILVVMLCVPNNSVRLLAIPSTLARQFRMYPLRPFYDSSDDFSWDLFNAVYFHSYSAKLWEFEQRADRIVVAAEIAACDPGFLSPV